MSFSTRGRIYTHASGEKVKLEKTVWRAGVFWGKLRALHKVKKDHSIPSLNWNYKGPIKNAFFSEEKVIIVSEKGDCYLFTSEDEPPKHIKLKCITAISPCGTYIATSSDGHAAVYKDLEKTGQSDSDMYICYICSDGSFENMQDIYNERFEKVRRIPRHDLRLIDRYTCETQCRSACLTTTSKTMRTLPYATHTNKQYIKFKSEKRRLEYEIECWQNSAKRHKLLIEKAEKDLVTHREALQVNEAKILTGTAEFEANEILLAEKLAKLEEAELK